MNLQTIMRAVPRFALLLALGLGAAQAARDPGTYRIESGGTVLEIDAPRGDIVRVRAGRGSLPEDASWAVAESVRRARVPLEVHTTGGSDRLNTGELIVDVDRATLHVTVRDAAGRVLLADAEGESLSFERGVHLRKAMAADGHFFGLGDKTGLLDRRGGSFQLWNTDQGGFGESTDPLYKSIPFVLGVTESGRSVGLFFDNTWRSYFDFGHREADTLSFGADGGPVDYYVIGGADPRAIVQGYAFLTGTAPLPPLWALGFQQSRWSYATEAQARSIADRLRADRIPADVLYLDIDYQDRNRPFTVSGQAFPDLPKFIADMKALALHVILITDLHVARVEGEGYRPFETGRAIDAFVHRPDGSTYVADVWPGPAVFPDFSRLAVRDWWGQLYKDFVAQGAAGFWNDMNEPAVFNVRSKTMPLDNVHRIEEPGFATRNASHAEMHNVFGMLNSEATYEGLRRLAPDQRPFVLTRASFAGGQRYAATWTGDNTSSWNHLRLSVPMLTNLGLSGFAFVGDDIGGFEGPALAPDLLTRWVEVGAFNPIFRDHATKEKPPQELWVHGPEHEAIRRHYVEERYRLLPYLYTLAERAARTGLPMMEPVFLEFPAVLAKPGRLGGTADQFLLGPDLLVAPPPFAESPGAYAIALPGAGWYDYWTGRRVAGDLVTETPRLERLPVFVRPGAIVPRQPLVQSTAERPVGPLELDVYPGPTCEGDIYLDDGTSMAYRAGAYLRQHLTCVESADALELRIGEREGSFVPWWNDLDLVIHGLVVAPGTVLADGRRVDSRFDASAQTLHVRVPARSAGVTVALHP